MKLRWWTPPWPVSAVEREWIDESSSWLLDQFGDQLLRSPVLPADGRSGLFPEGYTGTQDEVREVFGRTASHMGVGLERVELEFVEPDCDPEVAVRLGLVSSGSGIAGHWQRRGNRTLIAVRSDLATRPVSLVGTLAHELAHERLLGEGRIDPDRRDGEPLTDLLVVFFGLGVFAANAALEFENSTTGWRTSRLGYLTERMYGYAHARLAWLRDEPDARWVRHLDANPRTWAKQSLRRMRATQGSERAGEASPDANS